MTDDTFAAHGQAEDPLDQALDQAMLLDGAQRQAWLQRLRQKDPELAQQVDSLLQAADSLGELDDGPGLMADHLTENLGELPAGTRLGAWQVLELLGRGGMGRVYLAKRADGAFEKQVAIKVLRRERRLPEATLEHERALLARLEHPGVTRLLDGGISADGDVFLVMERVRGQSLDAWCRERQADTDSRLDLFRQVLDAVAHAHRQLVVHGDIKPDNILVDDQGRVRVLDFGVARLLAAEPHTAARGLTPGWAAPECRDGTPPQVASDIFSLGLLLGHLIDAPASTPPRDLKAIFARATADDPNARYDTVADLRRDLARYRRHQPVSARDGGRMYIAARFVRRHRFGVAAAAVVLALVLAGGSIIIHQNRVVRSERDAARLAAARSQTVLDYLLSVVGKARAIGGDEPGSLDSLLQDSLAHIDADFANDPAAGEALLARLGELLVNLGNFSDADQVLQRFVESTSSRTPSRLLARALDHLALVRLHQGRLDDAAQLTERGLAALKHVRAEQRGAHSQLLVTQSQIQTRQGDVDAAIATLERALTLRLAVSGEDAAQTVVVRNSLAVALMRSGQYGAALQQFQALDEALQSSRRSHSLDAATIYGNHASTAFAYGRYRQAQQLFDRALALQTDLYGPSARLAALLNNAGKLNLALGHVRQGQQQIQRAVAMMTKFSGTDSIDAQLIRLSLGAVALAEGHPQDAADIYAELGASLATAIGAGHPLVARVDALELAARARTGDLSATDNAFDATIKKLTGSPRGARPLARLQCARAELALRQGLDTLAATSAAACVQARRESLDANSPPLLIARYLLATAKAAHGADNPQQAALLAQLHERLGPKHPTLQRLATLPATQPKH